MKHAHPIWSRIQSAEVAQYLLTLGFTEDGKTRYQILAAKEQTELTPDERSEIESLVAANTALMLLQALQAKARLALRNANFRISHPARR